MCFHVFAILSLLLAPAQASPVRLVVNGRPAAPGSGAGLALVRADGTLFLNPERLPAVTGAKATSPTSLAWFGRELRFSAGNRRYWVTGDGNKTAAVEPFASDGLWVPAEMLQAAFGWKLSVAAGEAQLWGPGASLLQVRQAMHPGYCRVVLDLSQPCVYQASVERGRVTLLLPPGPDTTATAGDLQVFEFDSTAVPRVTREVARDGWVTMTLFCEGGQGADLLTLCDPPRLVIDFSLPRQQAPAEKTPPAPSPTPAAAPSTQKPPAAPSAASKPTPSRSQPAGPVQPSLWRTMQWNTDVGPATVHLVIVNPQSPKVDLKPALGGPLVRSLSSVAHIAKVHGALAAVNGGFFSPTHKVPLGMLVIDGEWMRAPLPDRPVLMIGATGKCEISRVSFDARVHFEGLGFLPVLGLNQNHWEPDSIVVFTHRWGSSVPVTANTTRLVVSARGRVVYRECDGRETPLPSGGMVISGHGRRAETLRNVPLGREAKLTFTTKPEWPDLRHALGGGPLLVLGSKAVLDPKAEGFRSDVASGRHARTAVGILKDSRVVIAVAEGGPLGRGPGLTLWELTALMLKLGAQSAMNLDGGSSTTLVVDSDVVTRCSAGSPRLVNNALVVVPCKPEDPG